MMKGRAVIFDMDGTLFQTNTVLELALEDTFGDLSTIGEWAGETPTETYREIMGVPLQVVWETLLPDRSDAVRQRANEVFHESLIAYIGKGRGALYPHAREALEFLAEAGCSIFIASNGALDYLNAIVSYYRLDRWITETFSIQQIESDEKADLVSLILKKFPHEAAVVVGDRIIDIHAARANGLPAIGCRFDFSQEEELALADIVIDDLLELKLITQVLA
ncbi:adenosylhomocysteine nucleosidase [Paenibacillus taihuensis]|uniref:Adenosylhomocysteine nucleosidase n=1 Tax=Paenibacillus taihuensis TaxID=1156355 RepID=A0A3D9S7J2_9BACL|nr:HAD family hydrolase [Paenibacillus taihuensis]REE85311.1 adenosylhomocysteine nucleosidase [Paenibacillus taihuensis]